MGHGGVHYFHFRAPNPSHFHFLWEYVYHVHMIQQKPLPPNVLSFLLPGAPYMINGMSNPLVRTVEQIPGREWQGAGRTVKYGARELMKV